MSVSLMVWVCITLRCEDTVLYEIDYGTIYHSITLPEFVIDLIAS